MTKVEEALDAITSKLAELFDTQAKQSEAITRIGKAVSDAARDIGSRLDSQMETRNGDVEKFNALTGRVDELSKALDDVQLNHMETTDALPLIRDRLAKLGLISENKTEASAPQPQEEPEVSEESPGAEAVNPVDKQEPGDSQKASDASDAAADTGVILPLTGVRSSIYGG